MITGLEDFHRAGAAPSRLLTPTPWCIACRTAKESLGSCRRSDPNQLESQRVFRQHCEALAYSRWKAKESLRSWVFQERNACSGPCACQRLRTMCVMLGSRPLAATRIESSVSSHNQIAAHEHLD